MKPPSIAPTYACLYPGLAETARRHGYALAIHGSLAKDLDLIAVPWTESASSAEVVVEAIKQHAGACLTTGCASGNPEQKPHGRIAWHLSMEAGACVDLSVMPKMSDHGKREATANDSSSETAEGGCAWRAGCAAGLRGAASVTRAAAPPQSSAALLFAWVFMRLGSYMQP